MSYNMLICAEKVFFRETLTLIGLISAGVTLFIPLNTVSCKGEWILREYITGAMLKAALKEQGLFMDSSRDFDETIIYGISQDSRETEPGSIFICKGKNFREEYLLHSRQRGAVCYAACENYYIDMPHIQVSDDRKALAVASKLFYLRGEKPLKTAVITGTKGKTTACYMLRSMAASSGVKCAFSSTVELFDGNRSKAATLTTPESIELYRLMATAAKNGCELMITEASSAAFGMDRIYGINIDCGVFLNITPDHISSYEHKSFRDYYMCKFGIMRSAKKAGICVDDDFGRVMAAKLKKEGKEVMTFSGGNFEADIMATQIIKQGSASSVTIRYPGGVTKFKIGMAGEYNIQNALGAFCAAYLLGLDIKEDCLENLCVPGRMEVIEGREVTVVVDYAHNKVSMASVLKALREQYPGRDIRVVFGCSGNKVPRRRMDMAYESAEYAKEVIITDDNPAFEDSAEIARRIASYLEERHCDYLIEYDRAKAIELAVIRARRGDIILIAGKGREKFQRIKGVVYPYEGDISAAKRALLTQGK